MSSIRHPLRPLVSEIIFYSSLSVVLLSVCMARHLSPGKLVAYFTAGFFLWTLIEYLFHRFVYHHLINRSRSQSKLITVWYNHNLHHGDPNNVEDVITQIPYSLPIALVITLGLLAVTHDVGVTLAILPGVFTGYLYYEWVHYHTHFQPEKWLVYPWQARNHLHHHAKAPHKRFGVTSPIWDFIFRTY